MKILSLILNRLFRVPNSNLHLAFYSMRPIIFSYGFPAQELYERKPMTKIPFVSCELEFMELDLNSYKGAIEIAFQMVKDTANIIAPNGKPKPTAILFIEEKIAKKQNEIIKSLPTTKLKEGFPINN